MITIFEKFKECYNVNDGDIVYVKDQYIDKFIKQQRTNLKDIPGKMTYCNDDFFAYVEFNINGKIRNFQMPAYMLIRQEEREANKYNL